MTDIVSRERWGAKDPTQPSPIQAKPASELWIHHSVSKPSSGPFMDAREIQRIAFQRGFTDISYSYLFHPDGTALEGRGDRIGAHTKGRNSIAKAFCFIGNYSQIRPTEAQLESARGVRAWLIETGRLSANHVTRGHRQNPASPSECPGNHLFPRISEILRSPGYSVPSPEEDDMHVIKSREEGHIFLVSPGGIVTYLSGDDAGAAVASRPALTLSKVKIDELIQASNHIAGR